MQAVQMMWAFEFTPSQPRQDQKDSKMYSSSGKFGQQNLKYGNSKIPGGNAPLVVFCMAAIFKLQRQRLLKETQGLDDIVKVLSRSRIEV